MDEWPAEIVAHLPPMMVESSESYDRETIQRHLTACCMYSYQFDGYLNTACQHGTYPINNLVRHFDESVTFSKALTTFPTPADYTEDLDFPNPLRPTAIWHGTIITYATFRGYLDFVRLWTKRIYETFVAHSQVLSRPMIVCRGIVPRMGRPLRYEIAGFTSATYDCEIAAGLAYSLGASEEFGKPDYDRATVFSIELPIGTRYIPMYYSYSPEELEIVVLTQGHLEPTGSEFHEDDVNPYTKIACRLIPTAENPTFVPLVVSEPLPDLYASDLITYPTSLPRIDIIMVPDIALVPKDLPVGVLQSTDTINRILELYPHLTREHYTYATSRPGYTDPSGVVFERFTSDTELYDKPLGEVVRVCVVNGDMSALSSTLKKRKYLAILTIIHDDSGVYLLNGPNIKPGPITALMETVICAHLDGVVPRFE